MAGPVPKLASTGAHPSLPLVVKLPKKPADEQSTISATTNHSTSTNTSTSTVTPSTVAKASDHAKRKHRPRSKKRLARKDSDSDSNSDNLSLLACIDDETAGSTAAKRIAVLAKANATTTPVESSAGSSKLVPTLPSKGTVSKRALKRARGEVQAQSSKVAIETSTNVSKKVTNAPSSSANIDNGSITPAPAPPSSSPALPSSSPSPSSTKQGVDQPPIDDPSTMDDYGDICRDYTTYGRCGWGSRCALRHVLPVGAEARPPDPDEKELCRVFWNLGHCPRRHSCGRKHLYKRTLPEIPPASPTIPSQVQTSCTASTLAPPKASTTASVSPASTPAAKPASTQLATPSQLRVESAEKKPVLAKESAKRPPEVCKSFLAGKCRKSGCLRVHPASDAQSSQSTASVSEAQSSSSNSLATSKGLKPAALVPKPSPSPVFTPIASSAPIDTPKVHHEPITTASANLPPKAKAPVFCRDFLAGRCRSGLQCRRFHPPLDTQAAQTPVQPVVDTAKNTVKEPEVVLARPTKHDGVQVDIPSASATPKQIPPPVSTPIPTTTEVKQIGEVPNRQQKVVRWLEEHSMPPEPTADTSKRRSKPISRESSMSSTTSTSESDYFPRIRTVAEEDYGWATSSESDEPTTPPHSTYEPGHSSLGAKRSGGDYASSARSEPSFPRSVCRLWARGLHCPYGDSCNYAHAHPICMNWLQGYCRNGSSCIRRHVQDVVTPHQPVFPKMSVDSATRYTTVNIFDYIRVVFGPGFAIEKISTAFDFGSIIVQNVPPSIDLTRVENKLGFYGRVGQPYRKETDSGTPGPSVYADFASQHEAASAVAALNGANLWGATLAARLLSSIKTNGLICQREANVRFSWDAPGRVGYAGFDTRGEAEAVVQRLDGTTHSECIVEAITYSGLPALNRANVKFWLPATMMIEELRRLVGTQEVMLDPPNYLSLRHAEQTLHSMAGTHGTLVSFRTLPPIPRIRKVRAWAEYASIASASAAAKAMHGFKNRPFGKHAVWAHQISSLEYSLSIGDFEAPRDEFLAMQASCGKSMDLPSVHITHYPANVVVRLMAQDTTVLARLKSDYERILHGEDIKEHGETVWDEYFKCSSGKMFLYGVEQSHPGITIKVNQIRRKLTVLGPSASRAAAVAEVLAFVSQLRSEQTYAIPLTGNPVGFLMSPELLDLQVQFGAANVVLNLTKRVLAIRGSASAVETARVAILHASQRYPSQRPSTFKECPACNNEVNAPVALQCGHEWCQTCLAKYLSASTDNSLFPLACFGGGGRCAEPIPLSIARRLVPADQFDAIAHAAFRAHVNARPHEFRACPTADCAQVYRPVPPDAVLSCPSCLARICGRCGEAQHEGTPCTSREADAQFEEWRNTHDVKACPGCGVFIEKAEGCNHMTCTRCRTHICWTCSKTFPQGDGIYGHMRDEHGGIGLAP